MKVIIPEKIVITCDFCGKTLEGLNVKYMAKLTMDMDKHPGGAPHQRSGRYTKDLCSICEELLTEEIERMEMGDVI